MKVAGAIVTKAANMHLEQQKERQRKSNLPGKVKCGVKCQKYQKRFLQPQQAELATRLAMHLVRAQMPKTCNLTTSTEASTACSTWTTTVLEKPDKPTKLVTADDRLSSSTDNSDGFACDLKIWPVEISDSMREYWAVKGSGDCVNSNADFSKTSTRFEGDSYNQQCLKSLFTYTHELTKKEDP